MNVFIISIFFFGGLLWADSNGLWERAEDIKPGVFGADEGNGEFGFNGPVFIHNNLDVNTINGGIPITSLNIGSQTVAVARRLSSTSTSNTANGLTVGDLVVTNSITFPGGVVLPSSGSSSGSTTTTVSGIEIIEVVKSMNDVANSCIDSLNPTLEDNLPSDGHPERTIRFVNTCGNRYCKYDLGYIGGRIIEITGSSVLLQCFKDIS